MPQKPQNTSQDTEQPTSDYWEEGQKDWSEPQQSKPKSKPKPPLEPSPAEERARATINRQRELRAEFSLLPADDLIINDIIFRNIPSTSVSVECEADIEITETLRTEAPHIQPKGRDTATVSVQLMFKEGYEQTVTLRRLMGELLHSPFVFLENNKVRQALFAPRAGKEGSLLETMAFVLHFGSLSISQQLPGVIILDLQLSEFNYRPFSRHFWYSSTIAGIPTGPQGGER